MRIIRSFAAGLLLSAFFIFQYGVEFSRWYAGNANTFAFHLATRSISPIISDVMGGDTYGAAIFILLCLGAGVFIGATLYAWIEWVLSVIFVSGLEMAWKFVVSKLRQRRATTA